MHQKIMEMCYQNPLAFRLFYCSIYLLHQNVPVNTTRRKKAEIAVKAMLLWTGELLVVGIIAALIFIALSKTGLAMNEIWDNNPIIKLAKAARAIYEKIPGT
ncbi:MAG: hypothetical protein DRN71_01635 [Candidatus Nanohalarchaeota archaeon]|nr:MAG: hypothetical protein DRN71_01635 [Candidatus Nanohaloarchaeota archaeon]